MPSLNEMYPLMKYKEASSSSVRSFVDVFKESFISKYVLVLMGIDVL